MAQVRFRRWLSQAALGLLLSAGGSPLAAQNVAPPLRLSAPRVAQTPPPARTPTVPDLPPPFRAAAVPEMPRPPMPTVSTELPPAAKTPLPAEASPPAATPVYTEPPLVAPAPVDGSPVDSRVLPMTLDTVLRLAQDQNGQVRLARVRLEEADVKQGLADRRWL